jgi:hypothetical protein
VIIAQKLKKKVEEIPLSKSIKDLIGGTNSDMSHKNTRRGRHHRNDERQRDEHRTSMMNASTTNTTPAR